MLRKLIAALLALQPAPVIPQTVQPALSVPLVACDGTAGTAFRIGPHLLLSAHHVTLGRTCAIDGDPIHIIYTSAALDFSELTDIRAGKWLKVDCRGFVPGRAYLAIGHARGMDNLVGVPLMATGAGFEGMAVLIGIFTAQPGQSGGPIIDAQTHDAVGLVNAADWENGATFSVELKNTPVCGSNMA